MADRKPLNQKHIPGINLKFKVLLNMSFSTPYNLCKKMGDYNQSVDKVNKLIKKTCKDENDYENKKIKKLNFSKLVKRDFFQLCNAKEGTETLEEYLKQKPSVKKKIKDKNMETLIDQTGMDSAEIPEWKKEESEKIDKILDDELKKLNKLKEEYGEDKDEKKE